MTEAQALQEIASLRLMSTEQADRVLCAMHRDSLQVIGKALGLRLPFSGGDKPAAILGALQRI